MKVVTSDAINLGKTNKSPPQAPKKTKQSTPQAPKIFGNKRSPPQAPKIKKKTKPAAGADKF